VAGILTFENPLLAAKLLTLLLGASLIASGVVKIVLAFGMKAGSSWVVVVLAGIVTLLVGGVIVAQWPVNSLYISACSSPSISSSQASAGSRSASA
jgi:uncharacterized membrane protein HdeD (DUF308 family)